MTNMGDSRTDAESVGSQWSDLSFQQRYYFYLQQEGRNLDVLDGVFAFVLTGPLNVAALGRSAEELVARHDSLRTRISLVDNIPRQRWVEPYQYVPEVIDLRASAAAAPGTRDELRRVAEVLVGKKCQLSGGALFDLKILRLSKFEHVLIFAIHHLISDRVCRMILLRELWALYGAFIAGTTPPLSKQPTQFVEYLVWQQETHRVWLTDYRLHWSKYLEGATGLLWPERLNGVASEHDDASIASVSIHSVLTEDLRTLARKANTLLSIAVMAIYVALVSRVCAQKEFVVGVNTTGRDRMEFQRTLGFLAHSLFLHIKLTGKESFIDLLILVNQEYYRVLFAKDFGGVVMESAALLSGTLFQWMPSLEGFENGVPLEAATSNTQLEIERLSLALPSFADVVLTKRLNLMFIFSEEQDSISGFALYRPRVFPLERVQEIFAEFKRLAELCVAKPASCMAEEA